MTVVSDIPSPCIGVCRLDVARQVCEGCLRTTIEIARWPAAGTQEWVLVWGDLADFEIVPVVPSKETAELVNRYI